MVVSPSLLSAINLVLVVLNKFAKMAHFFVFEGVKIVSTLSARSQLREIVV